MTCRSPTTLTVAAAVLLLAARNSSSPTHSRASLETLLHKDLRYSHVGEGSRVVDPIEAFDELLAAGLVRGSRDAWWAL